jgi:hypothetical protein
LFANEFGNRLRALNDPEMLDEEFCSFPQASVMWRKEGERADSASRRSAAERHADAPSFFRCVRN